MQLRPPVTITQIDAFTDRPFAGNPAAIVVLDEPGDPTWMQALAAEVNLSETAFVQRGASAWPLRWFTPVTEVDLCGHATLATAHHLWADLGVADAVLRFETRSGELTATRLDDGWIELDFPVDETVAVAPPPGLLDALGLAADEVVAVAAGRTDLLIEVAEAQLVRDLSPDIATLGRFAVRGMSVTAADDDDGYDFVSRFLAAASGIDEDPATGSAHCTLGPYWAAKLDRRQLVAYQASARGGVVRVSLGDTDRPLERGRVRLAGQATHSLRRI